MTPEDLEPPTRTDEEDSSMPKGNRSIANTTSKAKNTTSGEVVDFAQGGRRGYGPDGTRLSVAQTDEPWRKMPNEPPELYEAFQWWLRQIPPRSFKAAIREFKVNHDQRHRWRWDERANAFDTYVFDKELVKIEDERKESFKRIASTGKKMIDLANAVIDSMTSSVADPNVKVEMKMADVVRMSDVGAKLEQLGLGKPAEGVNETYSTLEQLVKDAGKDVPDTKEMTD
jgi:hypothetical protein